MRHASTVDGGCAEQMTPPAGRTLHHEALLYDSDDGLQAGVVTFARARLTHGERTSIVCPEPVRSMLAEALRDHPGVTLRAPGQGYARPAGTLAAQRRLVEQELAAGADAVLLIGAVPFEREPADLDEWGKFEAVINAGLADLPLSGLCLYDVGRLPTKAVRIAEATHPHLSRGRTRTASTHYAQPADYLQAAATQNQHPLETTTPTLHDPAVGNLAGMRHALRAALRPSAAEAERCDDYIVAVNEVVTNGWRHGRLPVDVRLWVGDDAWVCVVTDAGDGVRDPLAGYLPVPRLGGSGRGLWLARQMCDRVDLSRSPAGYTVRLVTRR